MDRGWKKKKWRVCVCVCLFLFIVGQLDFTLMHTSLLLSFFPFLSICVYLNIVLINRAVRCTKWKWVIISNGGDVNHRQSNKKKKKKTREKEKKATANNHFFSCLNGQLSILLRQLTVMTIRFEIMINQMITSQIDLFISRRHIWKILFKLSNRIEQLPA